MLRYCPLPPLPRNATPEEKRRYEKIQADQDADMERHATGLAVWFLFCLSCGAGFLTYMFHVGG